jgi:hypothetical protein
MASQPTSSSLFLCCSYNRLQLVILWWGIGQHVGRVLPINKFGHLVNHLHQVISGDGKLAPTPRCTWIMSMHSRRADWLQDIE